MQLECPIVAAKAVLAKLGRSHALRACCSHEVTTPFEGGDRTCRTNKPHKWGYKVYVLSGVSGYPYNTEIETGEENVVLDNEPDLGASSNVVMRLARMISRH